MPLPSFLVRNLSHKKGDIQDPNSTKATRQCLSLSPFRTERVTTAGLGASAQAVYCFIVAFHVPVPRNVPRVLGLEERKLPSPWPPRPLSSRHLRNHTSTIASGFTTTLQIVSSTVGYPKVMTVLSIFHKGVCQFKSAKIYRGR